MIQAAFTIRNRTGSLQQLYSADPVETFFSVTITEGDRKETWHSASESEALEWLIATMIAGGELYDKNEVWQPVNYEPVIARMKDEKIFHEFL